MKSIVVLGLARDCAGSLTGTLSFCEALTRQFSKVYFVFVENGSTDNTGEIFECWMAGRENCVILHPDQRDGDDSRVRRIARCRNEGLAYVRMHLSRCEMCLMLDMDLGLSADNAPDLTRARDLLFSDASIAGIFPNSRPLYYDIYALRHPVWCPIDVWQAVEKDRAGAPSLTPPEAVHVYSRQLSIIETLEPIKVVSAFGGMGLYRLDRVIGIDYSEIDEDGQETCEHVVFNRRAEGDLYIMPSWCIDAPREHLSEYFRAEHEYETELREGRNGTDSANKKNIEKRGLLARLKRYVS